MIRAAWRLPTAAATASLRGKLRPKRRWRTACWRDCKRSFRSGSTGWTAGLPGLRRSTEMQPAAPATHINDGLKQLATETSDLPVGAVVLLSDGSENSVDGSEI